MQALQGRLDTDLLHETGHDRIAEDFLKSNMILNTIQLILTNSTVGIQNFFSETEQQNNLYEAIKQQVAQDPVLAEALQTPDLTLEEKQQMLNSITQTVAQQLELQPHENVMIDTEEAGRDEVQISGFYSTETGQAYINDQNTDSTGELVTAVGAESMRARDDQ